MHNLTRKLENVWLTKEVDPSQGHHLLNPSKNILDMFAWGLGTKINNSVKSLILCKGMFRNKNKQ
jgi:phosphoglycerate-specific signal transduction histidine kinase